MDDTADNAAMDPPPSSEDGPVRSALQRRRWYRLVRNRLEERPFVFGTIRAVRTAALLGPTYQVNKKVMPLLRSNAAIEPWPVPSTVIDLEPDVERLRSNGFTAVPRVRPEVLKALQTWCSENPVKIGRGEHVPMPDPPRILKSGKTNYHYHNVLEDCPPIVAMVTCPDLLQLVGRYFNAKPVLARLAMYWSVPDPDRPLVEPSQFHFDTHGPLSAMLLCYLSDVGPENGAHTVISGTHGRKPLSQLVQRYFPEAEVKAEFGDRICSLQGPAGTMVIEDPSILHSHSPATAPRLVVMASYIPEGRSARQPVEQP